MEPFKNAFSSKNACLIAGQVRRAHPDFSMPAFRKGLEKELEPLELKQRMQCIARRLVENLPQEPATMFPLLVKALAVDEDDKEGLRGFAAWPLTEIVARHGLDHFAESMAALHEMTRRFTAEFAIRPFIRLHQDRTLKQMKKWTKDPDPHVRRLVSEGTRPLLPWGERLPKLMEEPELTLPLLESLHRDPSDYVRLSVSNHLNDFSKKHPELVVATLERWQDAGGAGPEFAKLARHACRTLIKQGHPQAMTLQGFGAAGDLDLLEISIAPGVEMGGYLEYRLTVKNQSKRPMRAVFDYAIHHRKANGSVSPKVFKGRVKELNAGEIWEITGRHAVKPITTRVYYAGIHHFEPRLNGKAFGLSDFILKL